MDNWNNTSGFGHFGQNNDNHNQDHNQGNDSWGEQSTDDASTTDDFLDGMFNDNVDENTESEPEVTDNDSFSTDTESVNVDAEDEDTPGDVTEEDTEAEGNDEDKDIEPGEDFSGEIDGKFIKAPTSAKNTATFSEKQIYKIINLMTVFETANEEETNLVGTLFSVRGSNVRKAMTLAETEPSEINETIIMVTALEQVRKASTGEDIDDPMDFAIALFGRIDALTDSQKSTMISLVKSYQDQTGAKRVRINRNSATAEVIKEIKDAMTGEGSIADLVKETGAIVESIEKAVS